MMMKTTISNTAMTGKMPIGDPPATAPTLHTPPLLQFPTDVKEDVEDNFLMPPLLTMSMTTPMTANSEMPSLPTHTKHNP